MIVVDEPTRGIDVGAKAEIFALIDRLAGEGLAVVMMTSEMPELLGLADRIAVMAEGGLPPLMSRGTRRPRRRSSMPRLVEICRCTGPNASRRRP